MNLSHAQAQKLIQARADSQLDPTQLTALETHLTQCKDCQRKFEQLQVLETEIRTGLQARWPEKPYDAGRVNSILHQIRSQQQKQTRRILSNLLRTLAWIGGAALFISILAWGIYVLRPNDSSAPGILPEDTQTTQTANIPTPAPTIVTSQQLTATEANLFEKTQVFQFPGLSFQLPIKLPEAPTEVTLYQLQFPAALTADNAQAWAERLGVSGNLTNSPSEDPSTQIFEISNGKDSIRFLGLDGQFIYIPDYANVLDNHGAPLPFETQVQIVEAFINPLRLLDQPYRVESMASERMGVKFVPLLDGHPVLYGIGVNRNLLEWINATLKSDGSIDQLGHSPQIFEPISKVQILNAAQAWARFSSAERFDRARYAVLSPAKPITYQSWQRQYPQGELVDLYGYIQTGSDPIQNVEQIRINNWTISKNGVIPTPVNPWDFVHAWGKFEPDSTSNISFRVEGWEFSLAADETFQGTVQRQEDYTILETVDEDGYPLNLQLTDFPTEIASASAVTVRGVRDGNTTKSLDWWLVDSGEYPDSYGASLSCMGGGGGGGFSTNANFGDGLFAQVDPNGSQLEGQRPTAEPPPGYPQVGDKISALEGTISITRFLIPDRPGLQQISFFAYTASDQPQYSNFLLEGDATAGLDVLQNLPVRIWGTITGMYDGIIIVQLERFEAVYPGTQIEAYPGKEEIVILENRQTIVLNTNDGNTFVLDSTTRMPEEYVSNSLLQADSVEVEGYLLPGVTFGGYQVLVDISTEVPGDGIANSALPFESDLISNNKLAADLLTGQVTIDSIELAYASISLERCSPAVLEYPEILDWLIVQPVWVFKGIFDDGRRMEIQVQALPDPYLK